MFQTKQREGGDRHHPNESSENIIVYLIFHNSSDVHQRIYRDVCLPGLSQS